MTTTAPPAPPSSTHPAVPRPRQTPARRASVILSTRPRLRLALLLSAPLFWLGIVYIVALVLLLITAFWSVDSFTGEITTEFTMANIIEVVTGSLYQTVTLRTIGVALAVTIIDVALALPIAFYMAKVATPRMQRILVIAVLTPLWASYLVKAYAWRSVLSQDGIFEWLVAPFGGQSPGYGLPATIITLSYLWLPYVILPIFAGLERVPDSLLEASGDLGGKTWSTLRLVVLPLAWPAIIAGTIFSFSLSLGDYITVNIVGGASQMLGNLVYTNVGAANNLPLASAIALIPIVIIFGYLFLVRRTGALNNL
ncbi:MAG TPA: ABC transporter permease [Agromyces sp.]|nr:ABC transporter permease [Agromyces sp.]